jgi:cytidyltransferase-like protein
MHEKTVMVSGCFDLIHGGHIVFFKTAAAYGKLYVVLGQDRNLLELKGKAPYFTQEERRYTVGAIQYVQEAMIATGRGILDFEPELRRLRPDIFIVNEDGDTTEKARLCRELGVEYIVPDGSRTRITCPFQFRFKQEIRFPLPDLHCRGLDGPALDVGDSSRLGGGGGYGRLLTSTTVRDWPPVHAEWPWNSGATVIGR